jgi:GxxExxY protein
MNAAYRDWIESVGSEVVDSAIRVHRALGPGLLESAYQACLGHELESVGLVVEYEVKLPVMYRGIRIDNGYRADMRVERAVIVENKAVERLTSVHTAQILTYLELSGCKLGFLLNWHVKLMKYGINRFVSNL